MAITGPFLVSCSALPTEFAIVRAGADAYLIVGKAHQGAGFPRVELEIFTVASVLAGQAGPAFFNVLPLRVEILQENFFQVSAITTSGNIVRFYYNTPAVSGGQATIYQREIDLSTRAPVGARTELAFDGVDPFILDGRTVVKPNHLYLVYISADGRLMARESFNLGALWGNEVVIVDTPPDIRLCEANILDPTGSKEQIQVLMQRTS